VINHVKSLTNLQGPNDVIPQRSNKGHLIHVNKIQRFNNVKLPAVVKVTQISSSYSHSARCNKGVDWMVKRARAVVRPSARHLVRTQHGVTASAGQRRGGVEVRSYLRDQAGSRSLIFDLSIAHDRFGSSSHVQQNGSLSHPQVLDGPMRVAAQRKTNAYKQTYADNQVLIRTFLFSPLS